VRPWRIAEWRAATRKLATHQIRKDRSSTEILFRCRSLSEAAGNKDWLVNSILERTAGSAVHGFREERMVEVEAELPTLGGDSKRFRTPQYGYDGIGPSSELNEANSRSLFAGLRALAAAGAAANSSASG